MADCALCWAAPLAAGGCSWRLAPRSPPTPLDPRAPPRALSSAANAPASTRRLALHAAAIPANPGYSSLTWPRRCSVGLRVAIATLEPADLPTGGGDGHRDPAATHAQLEGFFAQLGDTLEAIDFHKGRTPDSALRKLRRIFLRCALDEREVRLLRGVLADAQRMARLAADRGEGAR